MPPRPWLNPGTGPDALSQVGPVDRALLLAVRADADPALRPEAAALLTAGEVDPAALWDRAGGHQVLPAVARLFTSPELSQVLNPEPIRAAWHYRRGLLAVNLVRHAELKAIIRAMHAAGIPAVPLKGTYLAERYYGGLDGRLSADIDVLVPPDLVAEARAVLAGLGFEPAPETSPARVAHPFHDPAYVRPGPAGRSVVELHRGLTDPKFVEVDYGRLWARIAAWPGLGPDWPAVLPPEEELLFLAIHLPKHDAGILRLLADIDRAVRHHGPALDWEGLVKLAHDWRATVMLYFGLERARFFLGTPVPARVLARLSPAGWRRAAVDRLAGPDAVLAPPEADNLRANRFRLAYCMMLTPARKILPACWAHFFAPDLGAENARFQAYRHLTGLLRGAGRLVLTVAGRPGRGRRRILTFTQLVVNRVTTTGR